MSPTEAQVIVITGGTGGLGLATAQALIEDSEATDGGSVVLILTARTVEKGRQAPGLAQVEALAKEKSGVEVVVMALEIDEEASVQRFKDDVEEQYGRIDVLVSNAGEWCTESPSVGFIALFCFLLKRPVRSPALVSQPPTSPEPHPIRAIAR